MCAIAGLIGPEQHTLAVEKMLGLMKHRGPDWSDTYLDRGFACLGHNRLAIIDLTTNGRQPFKSSDGRYILVYNGEIYNYEELRASFGNHYKFRSNSDTEVLLELYRKYGKEMLSKLQGMFAFAIWDSHKKKLFAARDRFGVKPFYYSHQDAFIFGSEIKSIRSITANTNPNLTTWAGYFSHGSYGTPEQTFYEGVHQLAPGHFLELEAENLKLTQWYHFENQIVDYSANRSQEEVKEAYVHRLRQSIRWRFRSDVPVGINLSGGVDSSTLLSFVNAYLENGHCEAYSFFTNDDRYDELPWVHEMVKHTGVHLNPVAFSASEVPKWAKHISELQDEPFGGIPTLAYAKVFQSAATNGVKVLLDGQGMDEQWAGYDYYFTRTRGTIQGVLHKSPFRKEVLSADFSRCAQVIHPRQPFDNTLQNLQFRDLFYTKIPRALRFNDRVSMGASTELREPFLDHQLVELAFGLPLRFKKKGELQKWLLRDILKDFVSDHISYAPKRPLQTPQREWLGEELWDWTNACIATLKVSSYRDWFNVKAIEKELTLYRNGNQESSFHIWQWINAALLLSKTDPF